MNTHETTMALRKATLENRGKKKCRVSPSVIDALFDREGGGAIPRVDGVQLVEDASVPEGEFRFED